MKRRIGQGLAWSLVLAVVGCGGTDKHRSAGTPDASDAGRLLDASGVSPEASRDGGATAPSADAGARLDAAGTAHDAGRGAGPDGAAVDAAATDATSVDTDDAAVDAGAPLNVVFATFGSELVWIDPETAARTEVGVLRNAANQTEVFPIVTLARTGPGKTALTILDSYGTPTLGTVDLCTALVTKGSVLSRAASPFLLVEGITRHPNGTYYVSAGSRPSAQSPLTASTNLGTLNETTGAITDVGVAVNTVQDDLDMIFFRGSSLYGVDVASTLDELELVTLSQTTGAGTRVVLPTYGAGLVPLRLAYDESRDKTYGWRQGDRNLVTVDLVTGAAVAIGETHPVDVYPGEPSRGFIVAPRPTCP